MLEQIIRGTGQRIKAIDPCMEIAERRKISLEKSLARRDNRNNIIAEIKFRSPSKGLIRSFESPEEIAAGYAGSGCCGISVLTEPFFFGGDTEFIRMIRPAADLPVLRKDFIIDEVQVRESAAIGADAILLIESVLGERLGEFIECTQSYGMECLVEVHDEAGMRAALSAGARIIGINNRNLKTMETDTETTRRLAPLAADTGVSIVCESGIKGPADIRKMKDYCNGFLVGTYLMSAADPARALEELVCA